MNYFSSIFVPLLLFSNIVRAHTGQARYSLFRRVEARCPGKMVSPERCNLTVQGRSAARCGVQCISHDYCVYYVWDSNSRSCRLCETTENSDCSNTETPTPQLRAYRRVCENGGWWGSDPSSCSCPAGWAGTTCQRHIYDCREGLLLGYPTGVYQIQPPSSSVPVTVFCRMSHLGRISVASRSRSPARLLFNRTWQEYRNGFGRLRGEHWLGLQNLHLLTSGGINFRLRFQLRLKNNTFYQQSFYNFRLSDETGVYRLNFTSPVRNKGRSLGDSLSSALGSAFSTYDADHDGDDSTNCALRHQSGWWFPTVCNLTEGNPLGVLSQPQDEIWSGDPEEAFWINDLGNLAPWFVYIWLDRM